MQIQCWISITYFILIDFIMVPKYGNVGKHRRHAFWLLKSVSLQYATQSFLRKRNSHISYLSMVTLAPAQSFLTSAQSMGVILSALNESANDWAMIVCYGWTRSRDISVNTLRSRQNGRHFADNIFNRIFVNENVRISIKCSLKFVSKGPITNIPALVQIMWTSDG